jgi:signal transduction histidine kinase
MITAMGGTLGVESIVGTWSTFWVDLPLAPDE